MFNVSVFCSCRMSSILLKHACLMSPLPSCAGNCLRLAGACFPSSRFQPFKVISPSQSNSVHYFGKGRFFLLHLFAMFVYSQMDLRYHGRQDGSIPSQVWIVTQKTRVWTFRPKQMVCPGSRYKADKNISRYNMAKHTVHVWMFPCNCCRSAEAGIRLSGLRTQTREAS